MAVGDRIPLISTATQSIVNTSADTTTETRIQTQYPPATVAEDPKDLLTKFDGDELYLKLIPTDHNTDDLGSSTKFYKAGYINYISFMSNVDVSQGTLGNYGGYLGLFGTNELALGYGNANKDLTFTSTGLTLNKNLTVTNGNNIIFKDGDSSNPELVKMRMEGNDLAFYGVLNNSTTETESIRFTYDGLVKVKNNLILGTTGVDKSIQVVQGDVVFKRNLNSDGIQWKTSSDSLSAHIHRASTGRLYWTNAGNSNLTGLYTASRSTSWTSTSDRRLKKNIETLNLGLDAINKLKPVQYEWKHTESSDKIDYGFIAQEVVDVLPHAVVRGEDGNDGTGDVAKSSTEDDAPDAWGVNYTEIIAPLVKAVQELSAKCDDLQRQIDIK